MRCILHEWSDPLKRQYWSHTKRDPANKHEVNRLCRFRLKAGDAHGFIRFWHDPCLQNPWPPQCLWECSKTMRLAIPLWQGRVSPIFDEANRILLVDISEREEQRRHEQSLATRNPFERAHLLPRLGVHVLICGMISQTQQTAVASAGIQIIPHICGPMDEVIAAFLDGRIESGAMLMPGCSGRKRFRKHMPEPGYATKE
jgi:predicted Fe-Mo cluster-binding NifX family protein